MWNKNSLILAWVGVFLSITTPAFGDGSNMPLQDGLVEEFHCGHGKVIRGQSTTYSVDNVCGGEFYFHVDENKLMTDMFPMTIEMSAHSDTAGTQGGPSTVSITTPAEIPGGDIAALIKDTLLDIPDGDCDNREHTETEFSELFHQMTPVRKNFVVCTELEVRLTLMWNENSAPVTFERTAKRIFWCDTSGVKLEMTINPADATLPPVILSDSTQSLKDAMVGAEFTNLQVTTANTGVPIPAILSTTGEATKLMAVAFITQYQAGMVLSQAECLADGKQRVPQVKGEDNILFTKEVNDADLASLDLYGAVRNNADKLDLCGENVVVLLLDSMRTLSNEMERCDNFLAFRIHSVPCSEVAPKCEIITNGWTADDMRAIYRGYDHSTMQPHVKMFESKPSGWEEVYKAEDYVGEEGYGLLKVLQHSIDGKIAEDPAICNADIGAMLDAMEGDTTDAGDTTVDQESLPMQFTSAQTAKAKLTSSEQTPDQVKVDMYTLLTELEAAVFTQTEFLARINNGIEKQAVLRVISEAESMIHSDIVGPGEYICDWLPEHLEEARWIHKRPVTETMESVITLAGDLAAAFISKPELPCLEKMLKRFIKLARDAETTGTTEAEFMFDSGDIQEEGDLVHCGKANKCIEKMRAFCNAEHTENWEDIDLYRDDICKLHLMKKTAQEKYKSFGLTGLLEKMREQNLREGKQCTRNPLKPRAGLGSFWKINTTTENTYVVQGVLSVDKLQMGWRKVAICSCQPCNTPSDPGTTTEYDGMAKKRRRRK